MKWFNLAVSTLRKHVVVSIIFLFAVTLFIGATFHMIQAQRKTADFQSRVTVGEVPIVKLIINQPEPNEHTVLVSLESSEIKVFSAKEFTYLWKKKHGHYAHFEEEEITILYSIYDDAGPGKSYARFRAERSVVQVEFHIECLSHKEN